MPRGKKIQNGCQNQDSYQNHHHKTHKRLLLHVRQYEKTRKSPELFPTKKAGKLSGYFPLYLSHREPRTVSKNPAAFGVMKCHADVRQYMIPVFSVRMRRPRAHKMFIQKDRNVHSKRTRVRTLVAECKNVCGCLRYLSLCVFVILLENFSIYLF